MNEGRWILFTPQTTPWAALWRSVALGFSTQRQRQRRHSTCSGQGMNTDPADVARVRELLRAELAECYTCIPEEADEVPSEHLSAWLRGEDPDPGAAWAGHMSPAWRTYPLG